MLSGLLVLGCALGGSRLAGRPGPQSLTQLAEMLGRWDGRHYAAIVQQGYSAGIDAGANLAFFPAFPVLGWLLTQSTGLSAELALLLVAQASLAATFVLLVKYVRLRYGPEADTLLPSILLAFSLLPFTFFFRAAYSESLLVLTLLAVLYGMERRWPLTVLALVIGLTTAIRPVGVAMLVPFVLHLRQRSETSGQFLVRLLTLVPLACWGLGAFLLFQYLAYGDALLVVRNQMLWRLRLPGPLTTKLWALVTLEPIWSVFVPSSPSYWKDSDPHLVPYFSLFAANPIYFLGAAVLLGVGAGKGWLTRSEWLLGAGLLGIPYVTRCHEMCMVSGARFASVAIPIYLVAGHLLQKLPRPLRILGLTLSSLLLGLYAAKFALEYPYFY